MDYNGGFIAGKPFQIGPREQIYRIWISDIIWEASLIAISLFLGLFYITRFLLRSKETYYIYIGLLSLSFSLWALGFSFLVLFIFDYQFVFIICTYVFGAIVPAMLIVFLQSFLNVKKRLFGNILVYIYMGFAAVALIEYLITGSIYYYNKYLYDYFIQGLLLILVYGIFLGIKAVLDRKRFAWGILIALLVFLFFNVYNMLAFLSIFDTEPLVLESYMAIIIIFSYIISQYSVKLHGDLEKAHSELLVVDKMKDDFLATTTHELRTPLHGIIGLTDTMADELSGTHRQNLELIKSSATHLNTLVGEILDFSKIRAGRVDLILERFNLGEVARSVVSLMTVTAENKEVDLIADVAGDIMVTADKNRVRQVLVNLIGNAVKFTDTGIISVIVRDAGGGRARVSVSDTGSGIEAKDIHRIWNPFEQGGQSPDTRSAGGAGLGLPISKQIVELHGGTITAESVPGEGSTFTFELPVEPDVDAIIKEKAPEREVTIVSRPPLDEPSAQEQAPDGGKEPEMKRYTPATILAVDDDPVSLKIIEALCARGGYDLVTAGNGPGALDILGRVEVDLLLLDLMLPGMSGYEVCREVRETRSERHLPVIMVTARDTVSDLIRGFDTGANDYITKPFNRTEVLARIENQLVIKNMLDMEKSVINGLRREKDSISSLLQRSMDLKNSTLQMMEWEEIIREDLDIASSFQVKLMTHEPASGIESFVHYDPLLQIGGDIYDIFNFKPGVVRVFLGDATGHGITASLNTVKILSEYAAVKETLSTPEIVLEHLNNRFAMYFSDYQIVFTAVVADIDVNAGTLTAAVAGHPEQYVIRGKEPAGLKPPGSIVGLLAGQNYREETVPFNPGDTLVLFTDGIFELIEGQYRKAGKEMTENEALLLRKDLSYLDLSRGAERACFDLLQNYSKGIDDLNDDITVIMIRRV